MSGRDLVWVEEDFDWNYASDGASRFGAYLRQREHWFSEDGDPLDAIDFALSAWRVASAPVMSPGYVQLSADIHRVCFDYDHDSEELTGRVEVRLPHPAQVRDMRLSGWRDWTPRRPWSDVPSPLEEPERRPALLFAALFVVTVPVDRLPTPKRPGADVALAKAAVQELVRGVNKAAGPDVSSLLIRWRERAR